MLCHPLITICINPEPMAFWSSFVWTLSQWLSIQEALLRVKWFAGVWEWVVTKRAPTLTLLKQTAGPGLSMAWIRQGWKKGQWALAAVWRSSVRSQKQHLDLIITSLCGLWSFLVFLSLPHGVQICFHINRNDSSFLSTSLLVALWNVPGRGKWGQL